MSRECRQELEQFALGTTFQTELATALSLSGNAYSGGERPAEQHCAEALVDFLAGVLDRSELEQVVATHGFDAHFEALSQVLSLSSLVSTGASE